MVDVFWTRVRVPPAPPHEIKKAYLSISLFYASILGFQIILKKVYL